MDKLKIALIPGDGIGREVILATKRLLNHLGSIREGTKFDMPILQAGFEHFQRTGQALPESTIEQLRECDASLFGAVSSPSHRIKGYSSPIVRLRKELQLFANIRPIKKESKQKKIDLIIVRENTECLYIKEERIYQDSDGCRIAEATRRISQKASSRIAEQAFKLAELRNKQNISSHASVTVVHKSNVLSLTDGLFRECCREIYESKYTGSNVAYREQIVDSMVYKLFREPQNFDVIVAPNLYGDILSDGAAALVGSLGIVPSINLGDKFVMGEPVHGSAPDIAGKGIANPIASFRSAAMMLSSLGLVKDGSMIERAVDDVLKIGINLTPDLAGTARTEDVTDAVMAKMDILRKEYN